MPIFRSIRFNIILFCVIAVACALGTLIPQTAEVPDKVQAFLAHHPFWGSILETLGLFNVYYSAWFIGLLALMSFDIVVCKLYNKPPDPGLVRLPEEQDAAPLAEPEKVLALKPYYAAFDVRLPAEKAEARAQALLEVRGYAVEASSNGGRLLVTGTRHRLQRWGSYIAHVSLVVILAGAMIKALFGFEERLPILEGQSKTMKHLPIEVRVDKFDVAYYAGTRDPKRFSSDLRVYRLEKHEGVGPEPFEEGKLIGTKRILVNDPFEIPMDRWGLLKAKLYQASWGAGGMFRSVTLRLGKQELRLPQRSPTPLPGTGITVTADLMLPDFIVGPGDRPDNRSLQLKNPGVRFAFKREGVATPPLWLFKDWPGLCFVEQADGTLRRAPAPPFGIQALDPVLFSGIQAGFDPGFPAVLAGAVGMLVGLSLLFYLHRRRLWVLLTPEPEGCKVRVAGVSSRGARDFRKEFERRVEELRGALEGSHGTVAV